MTSNAGSMPVSLPHRANGDSPQKRVDELIRKYRRPSNPSPVMLEIFNDPPTYSILVAALRRQISLAKCRSQEFEDCQITVYDRALLDLSSFGESVTDPGALELYLTEFLGIVPIAPVADSKEAVLKHVELQNVLDRVRATHKDREDAAPCRKEHMQKQVLSPTFDIHAEYERHFPASARSEEEEPKPITPLGKKAREVDVRVARLLEVYQKAKDDYFSTKARDGVDSLSAVRFLRDSAENTLRYLHSNGLSSHSWVPDLEHTFTVARDKTAQILGGRNRHFEDDNRHKAARAHGGRKRHFNEDKRGKKYSHKRNRRVIDSYRPSNSY
ncbi:hypothetical protein BDV12DRAFT_198484 [Aspergillus spectabilis]